MARFPFLNSVGRSSFRPIGDNRRQHYGANMPFCGNAPLAGCEGTGLYRHSAGNESNGTFPVHKKGRILISERQRCRGMKSTVFNSAGVRIPLWGCKH